VFKPIKKETAVKVTAQDDLSLTSFMNNVHMVTPVKIEDNKLGAASTNIINEDTICSPFVNNESLQTQDKKSLVDPNGSDNKVNDISHAKRRLTSECSSNVNEAVKSERVNKVNKKSTKHRNIHDLVESPKYVYFS